MKPQKIKQNRWQDHFADKAKKESYPARSVYKLKEIQKKYRLIKKGDKILDLGCYPGSWLLYAAEMTGSKGRVFGLDLKSVAVRLPAHVTVYTADVLSLGNDLLGLKRDIDAVISDMAPATTGNKLVDHVKSCDLSFKALSIAKKVLVPDGLFVCKIFQGEDFNRFVDQVGRCFKKYKTFKPHSSRKASREIYIIGFGFTYRDL